MVTSWLLLKNNQHSKDTLLLLFPVAMSKATHPEKPDADGAVPRLNMNHKNQATPGPGELQTTNPGEEMETSSK